MSFETVSRLLIVVLKVLGGLALMIGCLLAVAVIYGFVAESEINYTYTAKEAASCEELPQAPDRFLGLAFSGGGSRAAMFAAGGAAALQDEGLLKHVTHISSISGGGFASSYLATNAKAYCSPKVHGSDPDNCLSIDLAEMKKVMEKKYFWSMELQQLLHPDRVFSPSRRIISLQDALDDGFLGERKFKDLPKQPAFYFNGVSYDSADLFVFSNQPQPHQQDHANAAHAPELRTISFTEKQGCPKAAPDAFPVALAVATSAAFPPVLGPLTIKVPARDSYGKTQFWHLGDGGVVENTGLDTLIDAALVARARNPYLTEATLISFNAGLRLLPEVSRDTHDPSLWSSDPGRLVDVSNLRADRYRDSYLRELEKRSGLKIRIVDIDYLKADLKQWPEDCGAMNSQPISTIGEVILKIPTDLLIEKCHAALMLEAAETLVKKERRDGGGLSHLP